MLSYLGIVLIPHVLLAPLKNANCLVYYIRKQKMYEVLHLHAFDSYKQKPIFNLIILFPG